MKRCRLVFVLLTALAFAVCLCPPGASACSSDKTEDRAAVRGVTLPRFIWPVEGQMVVGCGSAAHGVDIAVPHGTVVRAAANGVVVYAGDKLKGYGITILVNHGHGWMTAYAQNSKAFVRRGDQLRRGQPLALGGALRPLRFEMRKDGKAVDPSDYLPKR